ncbi:hypothetical protein [Listeria newyorkensis]|uniref:hypothetical protein n=1 Tax=Listeria newyorkensis TaxID=1497681 RepID=UPI00051DDECA|nr:hypothetical protein [Listeria newyorkensis]KGL43634.1 hypothetical protein EP58_07815 [Listeria newyorkensis]
MTGEDECEECPCCDDVLTWNLYCKNCDLQYTSGDIDEKYKKLCTDAEKFYKDLYMEHKGI